jgi:hypothetical protein
LREVAPIGNYDEFSELCQIELEVLSVVTQQVVYAFNSCKERVRMFKFRGCNIVELDNLFAISITMNSESAGK